MYCQNCGAEVNQSSKFCSSCGKSLSESDTTQVAVDHSTNQSNEHIDENKNKIRNGIIVASVVIALAGIYYFLQKKPDEPTITIPAAFQVERNGNHIPFEKFEEIKTGMTIDEINGVIGFDGVLISEMQSIRNYSWNAANGTVLITFDENGRCYSKSQVGLK